MTEKEDKYAVVADGVVVDTEPTKKKANEAAKEVDADKVEVVPVKDAPVDGTPPSGGIRHLR